MDETGCPRQLELCEVNRQQVTVTFDGEQIVSDAGLLPIRQLDQQLGILAEAARRLPDPRSQLIVTHSAERIIIQQVDQILVGDPDGNDAQLLRDDPPSKPSLALTREKRFRWRADRRSIDFNMPSFENTGLRSKSPDVAMAVWAARRCPTPAKPSLFNTLSATPCFVKRTLRFPN